MDKSEDNELINQLFKIKNNLLASRLAAPGAIDFTESLYKLRNLENSGEIDTSQMMDILKETRMEEIYDEIRRYEKIKAVNNSLNNIVDNRYSNRSSGGDPAMLA